MVWNKKLPLLALAGGIVGAALRGMQLATGFEMGTGLYRSGNRWGLLLIVWLLAVAALAAFAARGGRYEGAFEEIFGVSSDLYKTVVVLCGLLLALGGAVWMFLELHFMRVPGEGLSAWALALEVPFGLLCILSGACFVGLGAALSKGAVEAQHAVMTLPPLFWAAFHLLVAYRQYCVSANLALFTVEIFAAIACVMAYYHISRMLYGKPAPRQFTFWATLAVALSLTDVLGYALSLPLGNLVVVWKFSTVLRGGCLLIGCVYLFTELVVVTRKKNR